MRHGRPTAKCRDAGLQVTGLEPAANMRAIAQARNPDAPILEGVITNLPFPDRAFDFVLSIEVLRYLHRSDVLLAYREMLRVLRPGGRSFFTLSNRYALTGFYLVDKTRRALARLARREEPVHCEFVTPGSVRRNLNTAGFDHISIRGTVVVPVRPLYRLSTNFGARAARLLEPLDDSLSNQGWATPLAARLVVNASRPLN